MIGPTRATLRVWAEQSLRADKRKLKRAYPRYDEPWKLAEDRRLLRLFTLVEPELKALARGERAEWWQAFSKRFGRTSQAVQTRLWGLRAGERAVRPMR
jgi:hypothetical protein